MPLALGFALSHVFHEHYNVFIFKLQLRVISRVSFETIKVPSLTIHV